MSRSPGARTEEDATVDAEPENAQAARSRGAPAPSHQEDGGRGARQAVWEVRRDVSSVGWPSIPREQLLKGSLLQALYSIRGERQLCEQLDYNLLFRWFLDMGADDETLNNSTFSANRERFMEHQALFKQVVLQAKAKHLLSPLLGRWHPHRGSRELEVVSSEG